MKQARGREFLDFFRDIDERLGKENLAKKIALYIFGGAAVVIAYGSKRGTLDIDAYIEDRVIAGKLLEWAGQGSELEKKHGLYFHNANTEIMLIETPDWKERSVEILSGKLKHVQVMALGKEDLILSKLSRYNDRDREDIQFITGKYNIAPNKLIAYYKSARLAVCWPEAFDTAPAQALYFVGNLGTLDTTFNIVLREHFGLKPRSFAG